VDAGSKYVEVAAVLVPQETAVFRVRSRVSGSSIEWFRDKSASLSRFEAKLEEFRMMLSIVV
jgi:hypothetical protein